LWFVEDSAEIIDKAEKGSSQVDPPTNSNEKKGIVSQVQKSFDRFSDQIIGQCSN